MKLLVALGLLCLVVGLILRRFSKPEADLSIDPPAK